jgi:hypothetical protein
MLTSQEVLCSMCSQSVGLRVTVMMGWGCVCVTGPLTGHLYISQMLYEWTWSSGGMILTGENRRTSSNATCSTTNPHGLTRFHCRAIAYLGCQSPASHSGVLGLHLAKSMWDLWWIKWHWERFLYEFLGVSPYISFHHGSLYSYITWVMKICLLVAVVQKHNLTPSTRTATTNWSRTWVFLLRSRRETTWAMARP